MRGRRGTQTAGQAELAPRGESSLARPRASRAHREAGSGCGVWGRRVWGRGVSPLCWVGRNQSQHLGRLSGFSATLTRTHTLWPRRRGLSYRAGVSLVAQMVKRLPAMQETQIQGLRTHPNKCWPERHSTKDGPFKHICKKISILKRRKGNRRRAGSFGAQTGLGCQGAPGPPVSQSI